MSCYVPAVAEMCSIYILCVLYGHRYWMCIEVYYYGSLCIHGDRAIAPLIYISTLLHINYTGIVLLHERTCISFLCYNYSGNYLLDSV